MLTNLGAKLISNMIRRITTDSSYEIDYTGTSKSFSSIGYAVDRPGFPFANPNSSNSISSDYPPSSATKYIIMCLGTGGTTPAKTDYTLENIIQNTTLSCSSLVVGTAASGNYIVTGTFSNVSSSAVTVSELGIYCKTGGTDASSFLLGRSVLDSPITMASNSTMTFTLEIQF